MADASANIMSKVVDGRQARREASRRRIIEATRRLIVEGDLEPTAENISHKVGLATRTLFRHFPDMESLYQEIIFDAQAKVEAVMDEPLPDEPWLDQLHHIVERRARIYEQLLPLRLSAQILRQRSASIQSDMKNAVRKRRQRLKATLPRKIVRDALLFEVIDAILSIEFWISLRRDQQLPVARATKVLHKAVNRLVSE